MTGPARVAHNVHMNLATPLRIRATFSAYLWPEECTVCGSDNVSKPQPFTGNVECFECGTSDRPSTPSETPLERGGWVDPFNPWGSFEQDGNDDSCEPDEALLPFAEALELLRDFPGGIWDYCQAEMDQNFRTGEWKEVTAHMDGPEPLVALLFDALEVVGR